VGIIQEDVANTSIQIVVGLDVEWNVDITPGQSWQGKPAVVVIAYGTQVYILQIAEILRGGSFPIALKNLLMSPNIVKVG
jgi:hypothetical protein